MGKADTVYLDRWHLKVSKNIHAPPVSEENTHSHSQHSHPVKDNLPLNVVNNYFSFGVDADIALQFHEARGILLCQYFNSYLQRDTNDRLIVWDMPEVFIELKGDVWYDYRGPPGAVQLATA